MAAPTTSFLSPTQRYAAGALFGLALHESQVNQTRPLPLPASEDSLSSERTSSGSSSDSVSEDPDLWVHHNSGLLRPVFKYALISATTVNYPPFPLVVTCSHQIGELKSS